MPATDLLGEENEGFSYLGQNLPQERLGIAVSAYAQAAAAIRFTKAYVEDRKVFGTTVASFQNTKFELASCQTEVDAAEAVIDRAIEAHDADELSPVDAASAKLFCTEMVGKVADLAVQVHGGSGYMRDVPVERIYRDVRLLRLYEGTSEIQQLIIGSGLVRAARKAS